MSAPEKKHAAPAAQQQGPDSLRHGVLTTLDLAGTSAATVAPAYSIYSTAAFIVLGVGLGSPLVVLFAGIAYLCYGNSMAQFARKVPSAGSMVSFTGLAFGGVAGAAVAFTFLVTGLATSASVAIVPGWWTAVAVQALTGFHLAWWIPYIVIFWSFLMLVLIGVKISTRVAVNLMIIEVIVLVSAGIVCLAINPSAISGRGFAPSDLSGGISGLGIAFPLAFYMFLGADTNISLSDETTNARKRQPRVIYGVIIAAMALYVFLTWAPAVAYNWNAARYVSAEFPLLDAVQSHFGDARFLLYLAGWTSAVALLITGFNSAPRIYYRAAREGMLPRQLGRLHSKWHTPVVATLVIFSIVFVVGLALGLAIGPDNAFGYTAGVGSVAAMIIYMSISIAVIVYYWRHQRPDASWIWHGVIPVIGCLSLLIPLYSLLKPGSPLPNSLFPYIDFAVIVAGIAYGIFLKRSGREMAPGTMLVEDDEEDEEPAVLGKIPVATPVETDPAEGTRPAALPHDTPQINTGGSIK